MPIARRNRFFEESNASMRAFFWQKADIAAA